LARLAGQCADGVYTRFNQPERAELISEAVTASGHRSDFDVSVWSWFEPEYADPEHPFYKELEAEGVTRLILHVRGAPNVDAIAATARYLC